MFAHAVPTAAVNVVDLFADFRGYFLASYSSAWIHFVFQYRLQYDARTLDDHVVARRPKALHASLAKHNAVGEVSWTYLSPSSIPEEAHG
jgi:hypothetical protein